ncbi:hypothetical protein KZX45_11345 [Georgenia sp. EYE_87]|uniref:hypothetical protein n=1 Tax=Georgenia sp. EYE_87 TaxID=2853448 RepID=UPI0020036CF5|nr:hypothetical protein [Georgenia sp. EYE_87]MCK6211138.1 hypothetical protein [Georgenia sp. EYE_87]
MGEVDIAVWLAAGYGVALLGVAHALDLLARRTSSNTARWRSGAFTYHADHDAWLCPEDQWLWPHAFDPENRVMRYRASPAVCNSCPVKDTCTSSSHGREVTRGVDPWPASEAERFHRGIACAVAVLGAVWPLGMMLDGGSAGELVVLGVALAVVAVGSWPLWSHLRRTPAAFPEHVRVEMPDDAAAARAVAAAREARRRSGYASDRRRRAPGTGPVPVEIGSRAPAPVPTTGAGEGDRFATRWGAFEKAADGGELPGGWSRRGKR